MRINPRPLKLTTQQYQKIVNMYQKGNNLAQIEAHFKGKISRESIRKVLHEVGVPTRGRGPDRFQRESHNRATTKLFNCLEELSDEYGLSVDELEQLFASAMTRLEEEKNTIYFAEDEDDDDDDDYDDDDGYHF